MRTRPAITALLVSCLAAAAFGNVAHAQAIAPPLPLGSDGHGVRVVTRGHPAHLVVLLSAARYRAVAGNQLAVVCAHVPRVTLGGGLAGGPGQNLLEVPVPPGGVRAFVQVPRRRTALATRLTPDWDWCDLILRKVHGNTSSDVTYVSVPLTPAGAAFVDERHVALRVIVSHILLSLRPDGFRRLARLLHAERLASPAQDPPAGRLGIYSDGGRHIYIAQRDRAGDLLFYEQDGDVVRTNLLRYLQDDYALLWGAVG